MADRGSIRLRITLAATLVVAVALVAAGVALVLLVRANLTDGLDRSASQRAEQVAAEIERSGPPASLGEDSDDAGEPDDPDDEPDDTVVQVTDGDQIVVSSQPGYRLPGRVVGEEDDGVSLPGGEHDYLLASEEARWQDRDLVVTVAVSREDVDDATAALVPLLAVGIPVLLVVLAGTTWVVVGRALAPVERIRAEVETITDDRLDRRVPEPGSRDEVGRLAATMNAMLARLQAARARQQRFVSDASHELRSPVATLRQSAEVARMHPDAFEPAELADTVLGESLRMQRLVEQLLVLARADEGRSGDQVEVDLDDLLLDEASRLRRGGLQVDTSAVTPVRLHADRAALGQIVRNLVDNAARHADGRVWLACGQDGAAVTLHVRDDGAGVPPAERERIFDRFVRLDDARTRDAGGSGLGLAIVRDLVHGLGGRVEVTEPHSGAVPDAAHGAVPDAARGAVSDAAQGAEFTVTLPAS